MDAILVAVIAAVGSVTASIISGIALIQSQRTHGLINSRMDELLTTARDLARAEGREAGEQAARDREG